MSKTNTELDDLLKTYPANVRDLALEARQMIIVTIPDLQEMVDRSAKIIGYGFGAGYADLICTIILSKGGVKLGIVGSAELPDPNGLLEGAGKSHRYVALAEPSDLRKPGLKSLLKALRLLPGRRDPRSRLANRPRPFRFSGHEQSMTRVLWRISSKKEGCLRSSGSPVALLV